MIGLSAYRSQLADHPTGVADCHHSRRQAPRHHATRPMDIMVQRKMSQLKWASNTTLMGRMTTGDG